MNKIGQAETKPLMEDRPTLCSSSRSSVDYKIPFNEHWWDYIRYHYFNPWWKPGVYRGTYY